MKVNESDVQGLLFKLAEVETLVVVLLATLGSAKILTKEQVASIFTLSEVPEILAALIKHIEDQGSFLVEAREGVWDQYSKLADIVLEQKKQALEQRDPEPGPWEVAPNTENSAGDQSIPEEGVEEEIDKSKLH